MSKRIQQVNQLIREELSQIILKEIEFPSGVLVTVTRVETSVDLNQSKIYISVMPESKTNDVFRLLNEEIYNLQQLLNQRLNMRPIPKIMFLNEKQTLVAGKVEAILEKIKKKK